MTEQILTYKALFVNSHHHQLSIFTNNAPVKICMITQNRAHISCRWHHCWNSVPISSPCWHPVFSLHKSSANINESQWAQFLMHEGIQWYTLTSYTLQTCQTPFCSTAPLLPSIIQKQQVMEFCQEGSDSTVIPLASTYDFLVT